MAAMQAAGREPGIGERKRAENIAVHTVVTTVKGRAKSINPC